MKIKVFSCDLELKDFGAETFDSVDYFPLCTLALDFIPRAIVYNGKFYDVSFHYFDVDSNFIIAFTFKGTPVEKFKSISNVLSKTKNS